MKSSRVCWRPSPSGFSRNKYTQNHRVLARILALFIFLTYYSIYLHMQTTGAS